MQRFFLLGIALFLALGGVVSDATAQSLIGFTTTNAERQRACEAQLKTLPQSETFRRHLETLTVDPHPTGSPANRRVVDYIARVMDEAGLAVQRFDYDLYLPDYQTDTEIALVTPIRLPLNNQEYILAEDRFSNHPDLRNGWNAFSGSGEAVGEVVYVNYGRKEDFAELAAMGVSVAGKVVIARYGGNFRGFKAHYAEQYGAIGLVIYSDPEDGGYTQGATYPEDRYFSESTIQRGSLLTLPYTGDPLTPFEPALARESSTPVDRLDPAEIEDLHTIPVAPLPHASAQEILKRMTGAPVPNAWQGGLPFTYRLTGGPDLTVRVQVQQDYDLVRATNVVGMVRGAKYPEQKIILGSHLDAWAFGAVDPNGGTAMLLTLAEALADLAEAGCQPDRTIQIAHWDAEEYGIIGSAEWVEELRDDLTTNAIAYINADGAVSGSNFGASASPSMKRPIFDAAKSVTYPKTDMTVYEWWQQRSPNTTEPRMGNLGGGSDHVGFYTHIGVPSSSQGFSNPSPIYHSNYDNFAWYERFGDTEFIFGPTLAVLDGILALRLANADILPYDVLRYPADVTQHLADMTERAAQKGWSFGPWQNALAEAIEQLRYTAQEFESARSMSMASPMSAEKSRQINGALIGLEKAWVLPEGLQDRPWFRSLYGGPDPFSGYAAWMLPGLRYEIEAGTEAGLQAWAAHYEHALTNLHERLTAIIALING